MFATAVPKPWLLSLLLTRPAVMSLAAAAAAAAVDDQRQQ